ncbi:MAG: nucleotidyltransferase [Bacteriovoracaceae bacterium]
MGHSKKPLSRQQEVEQKERDYHDHNLTELPNILKTLFAALETIEEHNIPYALIGGLAAKELGRPRITHDIDVFVKPDDADYVLKILEQKGFEVEKRDPFWLYKAWKENILVDVIFKSSGDIYFSEEVMNHVRRIPFQGRLINTISPEDFIVIKAAAHQEENPHHWHDALAVLAQGNLDWDYLLKRAKLAPRRMLALLLYAQSNDIAVSNESIQKLYHSIFDHPTYQPEPVVHPYKLSSLKKTATPECKNSPIYIKGRIMEALSMDERIAEHDIKVIVTDSTVVAKGEVFTAEQRDAVNEVITSLAPDYQLQNLVNVRVIIPPESSEAIT